MAFTKITHAGIGSTCYGFVGKPRGDFAVELSVEVSQLVVL